MSDNTSTNVKVTFLNNEGGAGFAQQIELEESTTIEQFLEDQDVNADRFQIRVRTQGESGQKTTFTPTSQYVLKSGDFVTAVPQKVGGGARD